MMTLRKIAGLAAVAAILGGAVWWQSRQDPKKRISAATDRVEHIKFFASTPEDRVRELRITWPDGTDKRFQRLAHADWIVETAHGWRRAASLPAAHLLHTKGVVEELRANIEGSLQSTSASQLERFGLREEDAPRVRFLDGSGKIIEDLLVSSRVPNERKSFSWVRRHDEDRVFLIEASIHDNFTFPPDGEWRAPFLNQFFVISSVEWIQFESVDPVQSYKARFVQDVEKDYPVFIEHDGGEEAPIPLLAKRLISNFNTWKASAHAEDLTELKPDFSEPFGKVSIKTTNLPDPVVVTIGSPVPGRDGERWVTTTLDDPSWGAVFTVRFAELYATPLVELLPEESPKRQALQQLPPRDPKVEPPATGKAP